MPLPPERPDGISVELRAKAEAPGMRLEVIMMHVADVRVIRPGADEHHACGLSLKQGEAGILGGECLLLRYPGV
jgi:hypothetical protein